MRQYLKVLYMDGGRTRTQDFKLSEVRFINTILKEQSDNKTCSVSLEECTQERYIELFGS